MNEPQEKVVRRWPIVKGGDWQILGVLAIEKDFGDVFHGFFGR